MNMNLFALLNVEESQFSSNVDFDPFFDDEHDGKNTFSSNIDFLLIDIYCFKISNNLVDFMIYMYFDNQDFKSFQLYSQLNHI